MLDALKVSRERAGIPDSLLLHTLAVLPFLADASRQGSAQSLFSDPAILVQLGCALVELATGVSARYRQPYGKTGESIPLHIDRLIQSLSRQPGDPSGSKSQTNALGAIHADLQYEMRKDIVQRNVAELTGRVQIQRRVVRLVGEIGIDTPKSEAGNRYIVLVSAAPAGLESPGSPAGQRTQCVGEALARRRLDLFLALAPLGRKVSRAALDQQADGPAHRKGRVSSRDGARTAAYVYHGNAAKRRAGRRGEPLGRAFDDLDYPPLRACRSAVGRSGDREGGRAVWRFRREYTAVNRVIKRAIADQGDPENASVAVTRGESGRRKPRRPADAV